MAAFPAPKKSQGRSSPCAAPRKVSRTDALAGRPSPMAAADKSAPKMAKKEMERRDSASAARAPRRAKASVPGQFPNSARPSFAAAALRTILRGGRKGKASANAQRHNQSRVLCAPKSKGIINAVKQLQAGAGEIPAFPGNVQHPTTLSAPRKKTACFCYHRCTTTATVTATAVANSR